MKRKSIITELIKFERAGARHGASTVRYELLPKQPKGSDDLEAFCHSCFNDYVQTLDKGTALTQQQEQWQYKAFQKGFMTGYRATLQLDELTAQRGESASHSLMETLFRDMLNKEPSHGA